MAISFVGANYGTGTTVSMPAHQAGDMLVIFAFRSGSTTAPGNGAGWSSRWDGGANSCSFRMAARVATSSGTVSGTWSNATNLSVAVYRSDYGFLGGSAADTALTGAARTGGPAGSSSTLSYLGSSTPTNPVRMYGQAGVPITWGPSAWVVQGAGHRTATNLLASTPSGYTSRTASNSGSRIIDSNGSAWAGANATQSVGASSGWITQHLLLVERTPTPWPDYSDPFDGATLGPFWTPSTTPPPTVSGGNLILSAGAASNQVAYATAGPYDLRGTELTLGPTSGTISGSNTNTALLIQTGSGIGNYAQILHRADVGVFVAVGGEGTAIGGVPAWVRITESGGTLTIHESPDGDSWTTLMTADTPDDYAFSSIVLGAQAYATGESATLTVGGFNVLPPPSGGDFFAFF